MRSAQRVVSVSLGTTVSRRDGLLDIRAVESIASQFCNLASMGWKVAGVVGAGGLGRQVADVARRFDRDKRGIDSIQIRASRVNAFLLLEAIRRLGAWVNSEPLKNFREIGAFLESASLAGTRTSLERTGRVAVAGGLRLGLTSDSSAATLSMMLQCPLVIVSTVGGIFDTDGAQDEMGKRPKLLSSVDRNYIRRVANSRPNSHVLDRQTCDLLLSIPRSDRRNFFGVVTGYQNISKTMSYVGKLRRHQKFFTRLML